MSRPETDDIAQGNLIVPSHKPLAGADDPPIDVGSPDASEGHQEATRKEKETQVGPGIPPSSGKGRLF